MKDLPVVMDSVNLDYVDIEPNYWLSCILIDKAAMCRQTCGEQEALYGDEPGKSCPTEILEVLTLTDYCEFMKVFYLVLGDFT